MQTSSSLLPLIEAFNNRQDFALTPFWYKGNLIGYLGEKVAQMLLHEHSSVLQNPRIQILAKAVLNDKESDSRNTRDGINDGLELIYESGEPATLTLEFEEKIIGPWRKSNVFDCLKGWRNERYSIFAEDGTILFDVERAAVGLFGLRTYGCHMNGYVINQESGEMKMWIAKRSLKKQTDPGKLDNIAAGGMGSGYTALETMIKEAEEEAGIPFEIAKNAKHVGTISYYQVRGNGIESEPGTDFCFDLLLSDPFLPIPQDGEVDSFQLLSLENVMQLLFDNQFKSVSMVVIVDFMVRHGFLTSESKDYLDICCSLRTRCNLP